MIKVLAEVYVPVLEERYSIFIPSNRKIKTTIDLLTKAINELSEGSYVSNSDTLLYNKETGKPYELEITVKDANIVNGTKLILH